MKTQTIYSIMMATAVVVMLTPDIREIYRYFKRSIYEQRKKVMRQRVKHLFTVSDYALQYTEARINENEALNALELNELIELYNRLK
jgi:16S rRNA A1518/A1519 N6-dimethyltransferase RsmA/KsgA/DIM1 with predicted DNA glycosylase/AP lyase activity